MVGLPACTSITGSAGTTACGCCGGCEQPYITAIIKINTEAFMCLFFVLRIEILLKTVVNSEDDLKLKLVLPEKFNINKKVNSVK
ncbi:hypothetical protein GCM10027037_07750 [Mucilaginibacter koreensis]